MAEMNKIIDNLLSLYQQKPKRFFGNSIIRQVPENESLKAIAFLLHQLGVSTTKLYVNSTEMQQLEYPFILTHHGNNDTIEAIHYYKGNIHALSPVFRSLEVIPAGDQQSEVLVFDGEALKAATLVQNEPANISKRLLKLGIGLVLTVLLALLAIQTASMPAYIWPLVMGSGLTAFLSVILLLKEIGLASNYTRPFCGKEHYLGCSRLITSALATNKWGISWSALGLAHAIVIPLYILTNPATDQLLLFMLAWQVPAIIAAVMLLVKMWQLRTFCKLCMLVHAINLAVFITIVSLYIFVPQVFFDTVTPGAVCLFAVFAMMGGWLALALYQLLHQLKKTTNDALRITDLTYGMLQHNPVADEELLQQLQSAYQPLPLYTTGNDEDKPSLLIILGLHCAHCARLVRFMATRQVTENWHINLLLAVDTHVPTAGTVGLLTQLQHDSVQAAGRLGRLLEWYATVDSEPNDEAAFDARQYPFCISMSNMPFEHLPCVFIAGKKMPYPLGADSFHLALFIRLQQLEAQEIA